MQDAVGSTRGAAPVGGEGEQEPSPPWERTGRDWGGPEDDASGHHGVQGCGLALPDPPQSCLNPHTGEQCCCRLVSH